MPMRLLLLILFLLAAPVLSQEAPRAYESAFGENTLSKCELIVHAVASATRKSVGAAVAVDLTVQEVIYGTEKATELKLLLTDSTILKQGEAVEALFALKPLAERGYSLIGKPVVTSGNDGEKSAKIAVCRAFIELESSEAGEARTTAFEDLLALHLDEGGYPAQNAAVELLLWVARKPALVSRARFDRFRTIAAAAKARLDERSRQDVELALAGMVETRLKDKAFRDVRRGKTNAERLKGGSDLAEYFRDYPRAFVESDATLAEALAKVSVDGETARQALIDLGADIRRELRARKIEEEGKRESEAERVRHATGEK